MRHAFHRVVSVPFHHYHGALWTSRLDSSFHRSLLVGLASLSQKEFILGGSVTGWIVAFLLVATGWRGLNLFYFYQLGSWATRYQQHVKAQRDATSAESSVRGAPQVLAVSLLAVLLSLVHAVLCGAERPFFDFVQYPLASRLAGGILAHHATSLGDTWASEFGILSTGRPILVIRPWTTVPPGTNGGMSLWGTVGSVAGGTVMGLLTALTDLASGTTPVPVISLVLFGALCGGLGSLLDSILGALLQATYYDPRTQLVYHADTPHRPLQAQHITGINLLTNEQVNLTSLALTTWIGGWMLGPWLFASSSSS